MNNEIVRVFRLIEYVGPRSEIEPQIARSLHGTNDFGNGVRITAVTVAEFPDNVPLSYLAVLNAGRRSEIEASGPINELHSK